jgi:hypothetical protein
VLRPRCGIPQLEEGYTGLLAWRHTLQAAHADLHLCGFGWKGIGLNDMIKEAIKGNFRFRKLKPGKIEPYHIYEERNRKYAGWDAEKLVDKIDEKIEELKNIKKMNNGSVAAVKNNISLMLSNLYFRMKLLADFIRSDMK